MVESELWAESGDAEFPKPTVTKKRRERGVRGGQRHQAAAERARERAAKERDFEHSLAELKLELDGAVAAQLQRLSEEHEAELRTALATQAKEHNSQLSELFELHGAGRLEGSQLGLESGHAWQRHAMPLLPAFGAPSFGPPLPSAPSSVQSPARSMPFNSPLRGLVATNCWGASPQSASTSTPWSPLPPSPCLPPMPWSPLPDAAKLSLNEALGFSSEDGAERRAPSGSESSDRGSEFYLQEEESNGADGEWPLVLPPPPGLEAPERPEHASPARGMPEPSRGRPTVQASPPHSPRAATSPARSALLASPSLLASPTLGTSPVRSALLASPGLLASPTLGLERRQHRKYGTPTRSPKLTLAMNSPAPMMSPAVKPFVILEEGVQEFTFTHRRNDLTMGWGLLFQHSDEDNGLLVKSITEDGAMAAWNLQCQEGPAAEKALLPGDVIIKVNEKTECTAMIEQFKTKLLLKLTIRRNGSEDWD